MKLLLTAPVASSLINGNRITAERWARIVRGLGHEVAIFYSDERPPYDEPSDGLIALHATRSHVAIRDYRRAFPDRPIAVCLTGTDLHRDLPGSGPESDAAKESLEIADFLILLEAEGVQRLPLEYQKKSCVIYQSSLPVKGPLTPCDGVFEISIVGHLRPEKDPFLVVEALSYLPAESRIRVIHLGASLSPEMENQALRNVAAQPRYEWFGSLSHTDSQLRLVQSRLMVLTSKIEGAPAVISEAVVNGVPILATRIDATVGLLGADYPGLFPVGDARRLAELMRWAETDVAYLDSLRYAIVQLADRFRPQNEIRSWQRLLGQFQSQRFPEPLNQESS